MPWLVMALALAAGCGGSSGGPRTLDPAPSASPSPFPSPSLAPEEQVLAAVRAYYAALNEAGASGETSRLASLSTPECTCRQVITYLADLKSKNHRLRNARDDISSISVQQVGPAVATVLVHYASPVHDVVNAADGKVLESFPSNSVYVQLALKLVGGRWLVAVARELS